MSGPAGDALHLTSAARRLLDLQKVAQHGLGMNKTDAAIRYRGALALWGDLTGLPEPEALDYAVLLAAPGTPLVIAYLPPI